MRKVIRIDEPKEESIKPIELTHFAAPDKGWINETTQLKLGEKEILFYLGKCVCDGDMFMGKHQEYIRIYKGHLNDGVY